MAGERNHEKIELVEIRQVNDALAEMVALFRVELRSYKGIASKPNVEDGRERNEGIPFSRISSVCRYGAWRIRRLCCLSY